MCSNLFSPTAATSTASLPGAAAASSSVNVKSSAIDSDLVSVFSSLIRTSDLTPLDITRLYAKYSSPDPPSVQYLRNPLLFRALISQLFRDVDGTVNNISPENKKKMLYLLAYAAEAVDERNNNSQNINVKIIKRILSKKRKDPDSAPPTNSDSFDVLSRIVNKNSMDRTLPALTELHATCTGQFGQKPHRTISILRQHISIPVCAAAELHFLRNRLLDSGFYELTHQRILTPHFLQLLGIIATLHPLLRKEVFSVVRSIFDLQQGSVNLSALGLIQLKKNVLLLFVHLMHCGVISPVLTSLRADFPTLDHALVRLFLIHLIHSVSPPYSSTFIRGVLKLLATPAAHMSLKSFLPVTQHVDQIIQPNQTTDADTSSSSSTSKNCNTDAFAAKLILSTSHTHSLDADGKKLYTLKSVTDSQSARTYDKSTLAKMLLTSTPPVAKSFITLCEESASTHLSASATASIGCALAKFMAYIWLDPRGALDGNWKYSTEDKPNVNPPELSGTNEEEFVHADEALIDHTLSIVEKYIRSEPS